MIKAIVFDWYGVCTKEGWSNRTARELSFKYVLSEEKVKKEIKELFPLFVTGKIGSEEYLKQLSIKLGVRVKENIFESLPELNLDVLNQVRHLKKSYKTILFTGNFKPVFENYQKKIDLKEYFEDIFLSYEYGRKKNDPEMWKIILSKTRLKNSEIIFVDDNQEYLKVAKEQGIKTLEFNKDAIFTLSSDNPLLTK